MDNFVSKKSRELFSRLHIDATFLNECPSTWESNPLFINIREKLQMLKAVNDTAERGVKLMQDYHGLLTTDEEQKQFVLRCVQDHRKMYPDCKKETLKRKYPE